MLNDSSKRLIAFHLRNRAMHVVAAEGIEPSRAKPEAF